MLILIRPLIKRHKFCTLVNLLTLINNEMNILLMLQPISDNFDIRHGEDTHA